MSEAGANDVVIAAGRAPEIPGACPWCSSPFVATFHSGPCPRIAAIDYYSNGKVKQVVFFRPPEPADEESDGDAK